MSDSVSLVDNYRLFGHSEKVQEQLTLHHSPHKASNINHSQESPCLTKPLPKKKKTFFSQQIVEPGSSQAKVVRLSIQFLLSGCHLGDVVEL